MKNIIGFFFIFYSFSSLAGGSASIELQRYFSPSPSEFQLQDYAFFKWDQKGVYQKGSFEWRGRLKAEFSLSRKTPIFYFSIPELSFFYKYDIRGSFYSIQTIQLGLGRVLKPWSLADSYWSLGLWNSLIRWNPLRPSENGLAGAFLSLKADNWAFNSLLAGLHIPNQERQFIARDGKIYSHSRWLPPSFPSQAGLTEQSYFDVYYDAKSPFLSEILFQPSYLASFKIWHSSLGFYYWMKWSFAYKPVNHLYSILSKKNLVKVDERRGGVIQPRFTLIPVRQRLLSAEWGFDYKSYSFVFSAANTRMREEGGLDLKEWEFLNIRENFTYFSLLFKYNFSAMHFLRAGWLQSWFHNYSPRPGGGGKNPSILSKYIFFDGLSLDWEFGFSSPRGLKRQLNVGFRRAAFNDESWLSVKFLYYMAPDFYTSAGVDILGSKSGRLSFLNQFRHNDYITWRMAYVF